MTATKLVQKVEKLPLLAANDAQKTLEIAESSAVSILHTTNPVVADKKLLGMLLVASSAFTFSIMSTLIKYASYSMSSMETVFWRSFYAWLLNLMAIKKTRVNLYVPAKYRKPLAVRCFIGCASMSLGFYAVQQMVLADASVLIFTSPVITFFLGAYVLNEKIDGVNLLCALWSFIGVICVSRPTFIFGNDHMTATTDGSTVAIICALLGATCQAIVYVSVRCLQELNFLIIINYFMLTTTIIPGLWLIIVEQKFIIGLSLKVWCAVIGSGFFGFLGQLFSTRGFQIEGAGPASVMRYLDIVFVFIWDVSLLGEKINPWSIVGAIIICSAAVIIAIRKMKHLDFLSLDFIG